jgi:hypothetical protein
MVLVSGMNITDKKSSSGQRAFYAGIVIGVLLVHLSIFLAISHVSAFDVYEYRRQNLEKLSDKQNMLVILGTSRTKNATGAGLDISEPFMLGDKSYWGIQISDDAGLMQLYEPLFEKILSVAPDHLIILDVLFTNTRTFKSGTLRAYSNLVYFWLMDVLKGDSAKSRILRGQSKIIDVCVKDYTQKTIDDQLSFVAARDAHSLSNSNINLRLARELVAAGAELLRSWQNAEQRRAFA